MYDFDFVYDDGDDGNLVVMLKEKVLVDDG